MSLPRSSGACAALSDAEHIGQLELPALTIPAAPRSNIYAQVTEPMEPKVIAAASDLQQAVKAGIKARATSTRQRLWPVIGERPRPLREQGCVRPCRFSVPRARQSARRCRS